MEITATLKKNGLSCIVEVDYNGTVQDLKEKVALGLTNQNCELSLCLPGGSPLSPCTPLSESLLSSGDTLEVFDLQPAVQACSYPTGGASSVAASATGGLCAVGTDQGGVSLWDTTSGKPVWQLPSTASGGSPTLGVAVSPCGTMVAAACGSVVSILDTASGSTLHTLRGHTDEVNAVAFSADNIVVSASDDCTVRVWGALSGTPDIVIRSHASRVTMVAVAGDVIIAASDEDASVGVFGLDDGCPVRSFTPEVPKAGVKRAARVSGLAVSPCGQWVAVAYAASVRVWCLGTGQCLHTFAGHRGWVTGLSIAEDGCVVSCSGMEMLAWCIHTGAPMRSPLTQKAPPRSLHRVAVSGKWVFYTFEDSVSVLPLSS